MDNINHAVCLLEANVGHVCAASGFYETAPQGFESANMFVNHAVNVMTALDAPQLLEALKNIEREIDAKGNHRDANGNYADRHIDLDLIALDREIWNIDGLIVPHPRMHTREFVLRPMQEIWPDWLHPIFEKNPGEMLRALPAINTIDTNQPLS